MDGGSYLDALRANNQASRTRQDGFSKLLTQISKQQAQARLQQVIQNTTGAAGSSPVGSAPTKASTPIRQAAPNGGGVDSWIQQALSVLKLDPSFAPGIKNMIQKESSGNPRAINNWDSNAKRGTPSKGLMQTIDPTFKRWALPGYDKDVYDPISNIIAGVRYARNRYGDAMLRSGGRRDARGNYKGY